MRFSDETESLPDGSGLVALEVHPDERGSFTELFREEWRTGVEILQWNAVRSEPGVLRGVHVHLRHSDYLTVPVGRATVLLRDLRTWSGTAGMATLVELGSDRPAALTIPPGVAHGFLFHEPSMHIYGVSHYWDTADELGCHWSDPALGVDWPEEPRLVSQRDAQLGSLADLEQAVLSGIPAPTV